MHSVLLVWAMIVLASKFTSLIGSYMGLAFLYIYEFHGRIMDHVVVGLLESYLLPDIGAKFRVINKNNGKY